METNIGKRKEVTREQHKNEFTMFEKRVEIHKNYKGAGQTKGTICRIS